MGSSLQVLHTRWNLRGQRRFGDQQQHRFRHDPGSKIGVLGSLGPGGGGGEGLELEGLKQLWGGLRGGGGGLRFGPSPCAFRSPKSLPDPVPESSKERSYYPSALDPETLIGSGVHFRPFGAPKPQTLNPKP